MVVGPANSPSFGHNLTPSFMVLHGEGLMVLPNLSKDSAWEVFFKGALLDQPTAGYNCLYDRSNCGTTLARKGTLLFSFTTELGEPHPSFSQACHAWSDHLLRGYSSTAG